MKKLVPILVTGLMVVILYDAVTAFTSLSTNIPYIWFSLGSFIIYMIFGFIIAKKSSWYIGAVVGGLIGLADSTVGWAVSWNIGPGKPDIDMNATLIAISIGMVVFSAGVSGLVGGALSLIGKPNA